MARLFKRRGDEITGRIPGWLRQALIDAFVQLSDLVAFDEEPRGVAVDPLVALTGLDDRDVGLPEDPALRRLRPDGYDAGIEGGEASSEFRRFTTGDLARLQQERVALVQATLGRGDKFHLDEAEAAAWLGALNDLRLALGTRLGVSDGPFTEPAADEQERYSRELYDVLGAVQHDLLVALGAPDL